MMPLGGPRARIARILLHIGSADRKWQFIFFSFCFVLTGFLGFRSASQVCVCFFFFIFPFSSYRMHFWMHWQIFGHVFRSVANSTASLFLCRKSFFLCLCMYQNFEIGLQLKAIKVKFFQFRTYLRPINCQVWTQI